MSIKEPSFQLPVVWPERFIEILGTGANKPILVTGTEEISGHSGDYVIKLAAGERMSTSAYLRELLACFMAIEMDIPVVKPVIVNIDADFVESVRGKDCFKMVSESEGINFGSYYLGKGFQMIPTNFPLNDNQLEFAKNIFWFDMLIQNPDRTHLKPNMFTNGKEIVIFDHELAFSFLRLIGGDSDPWVITREKWPTFGNLFLPKKIKKTTFNEQDITEKITRIDDEFWNCARKFTPDIWWNNHDIVQIQNHVNSIKNNASSFVQHLNTITL